MPLRLGFAFTSALPPELVRPLARAVEAADLDELWVWEDCFTASGIASAALALGATERITIGVGLLPAPLRNVALTAMEFATLERAIPGRLVAGVGHGVQRWMAQVGARVESPVTLLREYSMALRRLLDGETVSIDGRYLHLDGVTLGWPLERRLPLMIGGSGPVTMRLAAELGDGLLLGNTLTLDEVDEAASIIGPEKPLELNVIVATGDGAEARVHADVLSWRSDPDPQTTSYAVAFGDAATVATQLNDLARRGVTSVAIEATRDEPDVEGLISFVGREVRPLLAS
ncbi:MAG: LLM class flavin-dependent oxidoreductase [Pseudolysinimonas sp.]